MLKKILFAFTALIILVLAYPIGYFVTSEPRDVIESNSENHQGLVTYVINLDRSKDRLEFVMPNINALEFPTQRISGVDGNELTEEEFNTKVDKKTYFKHFNHYPKKGTIGCSLSHIKAWQSLLDSPYSYALIFEDDVQFDPAALKSTINELLESPQLWDITSFEISHRGTPLLIKKLKNKQELVVYLTYVLHSGCYIINRKAAKRLLERALPINLAVDHYFERHWELGLKFTGIDNPRLVHQKLATSVIEATKRINEANPSITDKIYRRVFLLQTAVIRFISGIYRYFSSE